MGYELVLHIGQEWNFDSTIGGKFEHSIRELAHIDLSNPGASRISTLVQERQQAKKIELNTIGPERSTKRRRASTILNTNVVVGNYERKLYTDKYGMPLVSIPLEEIRDALAADWEDSKREYTAWEYGYRRFYAALQLIDAIIATFPSSEHDYLAKDEELMAINPLAGRLVAIPFGH